MALVWEWSRSEKERAEQERIRWMTGTEGLTRHDKRRITNFKNKLIWMIRQRRPELEFNLRALPKHGMEWFDAYRKLKDVLWVVDDYIFKRDVLDDWIESKKVTTGIVQADDARAFLEWLLETFGPRTEDCSDIE